LQESGSREERLSQLIASKDPMTFQALAAMTPVQGYDGFDDFDPSDEGEIARITERSKNEEDAVSEYEQSFITELGIDPEFFDAR
jgi:hypothetical protein